MQDNTKLTLTIVAIGGSLVGFLYYWMRKVAEDIEQHPFGGNEIGALLPGSMGAAPKARMKAHMLRRHRVRACMADCDAKMFGRQPTARRRYNPEALRNACKHRCRSMK